MLFTLSSTETADILYQNNYHEERAGTRAPKRLRRSMIRKPYPPSECIARSAREEKAGTMYTQTFYEKKNCNDRSEGTVRKEEEITSSCPRASPGEI